MRKVADVSEDFRLWVLLRRTRRAIHKARERELRRADISTINFGVLSVIQAIGNRPTLAEISRWLLRESHSISELIGRMEKEELVRRVRDLDKKNLVRIEITEKGQQVYDRSAKRTVIHRIMSSLSKEEQHQLRSLLEKLHGRAYKELGIDKKPPWP